MLSILAMLGIVSAAQLWRFNRYAIVLSSPSCGAVLTPGDLVVGQLAMTGSLTVLYNLSILVASSLGKKRRARSRARMTTKPPLRDAIPDAEARATDDKPEHDGLDERAAVAASSA